MSEVSTVKLLAPTEEGGLFSLCSYAYGLKERGKGHLLQGLVGFEQSLAVMASFLTLIFKMPPGMATGRKDAKIHEGISKNTNINWLSFWRMFFFGARNT